MMTIREKIALFNRAFNRPVNSMPIEPTVEERLLLAKLLLEETLETICLGLGLAISYQNPNGTTQVSIDASRFDVTTRIMRDYDPIETADGQADVNVVNHFMAHWLGFNLDALTDHVNNSNMSKLVDGKPIINGEGLAAPTTGETTLFDPTKPLGKILKGPNFWDAKPGIPVILEEGNKL